MDLKSLEMINHWLYGEEHSMPVLDTSTLVDYTKMETPFLESEIAEVLPLSFQSSTREHNFYPTPQGTYSWMESFPSDNVNLMELPQDIDSILGEFYLNPITCDELVSPSNDGFEGKITNWYHDTSFLGQGNGGLLEDVCNVKPIQTLEFQCESNPSRVKEEELEVEVRISGGTAKKHKSSFIGYKAIAKHFNMNIADAAKELNVGLTVLKKRCRELGISRWPHRKMKSLQLLIRNVEEMGKGAAVNEGLQKEIDELMEQRRQIEMKPQLQLSDRTKRLRQACFKANYKRRRAMREPRRSKV